MGLFEQALRTYDSHFSLIGEVNDGHEILAPIFHSVSKANIEITLNLDGQIEGASLLDSKEPKIVIPVTQRSGGRSGTNLPPHPLCDKLKYLIPSNEEKYDEYVDQLAKWTESEFSHPKLLPVLTYIRHGTIWDDLKDRGCIKHGLDKDGDLMIRWKVLNSGGNSDCCWKDQSLFQSFIDYYSSTLDVEDKDICMLSGKTSLIATNHPRGIVSVQNSAKVSSSGAKLISSNDDKNFTFLGRFTDVRQAATVSFEASQKAHNALRWLVAEQGVNYGGRVFLCWNSNGIQVKDPASAFLPFTVKPSFKPSDYQNQLKNTLYSFRQDNQLKGTETVVIASLEASCKGRLALTYYAEHNILDFVQRLHDWDATCNWIFGKYGEYGIRSPSLSEIISYAYGFPQKEKKSDTDWKMLTDPKLYIQQIQRLMVCKLSSGQQFPEDIARALVYRASSPQSYQGKKYIWEKILSTACAAVKKYRYDYFKEEWSVSLNAEEKNRSYLFGRLLAIAEKIERDTYMQGEERETNAMRMQTVFSQRPLSTWRILDERLTPYYKPATRQFYKKMIAAIIDELSFDDPALNRPLEDVYLLGYYSQRQALYKKNSNSNNQNEELEE